MRRKIRRLRRRRGERRERRVERKVRRGFASIETRLRRLGYQEAALDHISRLHISEGTLDFLQQIGCTTIAALVQMVLTRSGPFSPRRRSTFVFETMVEVLEALIGYYSSTLMRLRYMRKRLAKN